jgi:hypothetical protein
MVTTPSPDEPEVETQPAQEVAVETTDETTEIDYKAKAAELEAQVEKLTNDLRSRGGQRRRDTDRDAELSERREASSVRMMHRNSRAIGRQLGQKVLKLPEVTLRM